MTEGLSNFLEVFGDVNKTAIMLFILVFGAFFRIKGYIDGQGFVDLLKTCTVSYFATTTVTHFTEMLKDHLSDKLQQVKDKVLSKEIHSES